MGEEGGNGKSILYVSGSLGLGHIPRDLAISNKLRRLNPQAHVSWLAARPATILLQEGGECLLPEADQYACDSVSAETVAKPGFHQSLLDYTSNAEADWAHNTKVFARVIRGGGCPV